MKLKLIALMGAIALFAAASQSREALSSSADVVLTVDNTVTIADAIHEQSVSKAIRQLTMIKNSEVYLFLNSPGGSVFSGRKLIDFINASDKKIHCVAQYAASMAFAILQVCETRLVMSSSILMQHQATIGLRGAPVNNQLSFLNLLLIYLEEMDAMQAARMGITPKDLALEIRDDMWLTGSESITSNAADKVVTVVCSPKLVQKSEVLSVGFFGIAKAKFSKCPLITSGEPVEQAGSGAIVIDFTTLSSEEIKNLNSK